MQTLQDFANDRVKPILDRVKGLSEVNILGGREREVQIHFDPLLLAERSVSIPQLISVLQRENTNISAGALAQGKSDIRVRTVGKFDSPEKIGNIIIKNDDTGIVYMKDICTVSITYKERTTFVRSNGKTVLALNFQKEADANVMQVMQNLKAEVVKINAPGGVLDNYAQKNHMKGKLELKQVVDQTVYIDQAFDLVKGSALEGSVIAAIFLFIFLRSFAAVGVIAISIPISVVGAVIGMIVLGRTINVISLAGISFAVGMVVDNGIVVLENIFRHQEMGKSKFKAALDGTIEVNLAVLASTLTTLLVFIPILLIQEVSGQLLRDISIAIVISVGLSYIVSITVVPCAAALFLKTKSKSTSEEVQAKESSAMLYRFIYWLNGSYLYRIILVLFFTLGSFWGILKMMPPIDYLPSGNRNMVLGIMATPPGYSMDHLEDLGKRVENNIKPFWEASPKNQSKESDKIDRRYEIPYMVPQKVKLDEKGNPIPAPPIFKMVKPAPIDDYFLVCFNGMLLHGATSSDPKKVADLVPLFFNASGQNVIPGVYGFAFQFPLFRMGGSSGGAIKVDITGSNLEEVNQSALMFMLNLMSDENYGMMRTRPNPANFYLPSPELQMIPNLKSLSENQLTVADLGKIMQASSDGILIGDYELDGELLDLKLLSKNSVNQKSIDNLKDTKILSPNGSIISLDSVATLNWTNAPEEIKRVNRQRAVTLEVTPKPGVPLQEAINDLNKKIMELKKSYLIKPGVEVNLAGSASKLEEVKEALLGNGTIKGLITSALFLALVVVYLLMVVLFQSWIYPLVIMFTVPLATFGGFIGLYLVNYWSKLDRYMPVQNMDVLTILGFVILAGVVVNNAILIVEQTLNFQKLHPEKGHRVAISLGVQSRIRPIMMSMLTSVGGMLPLVIIPGSGSELYRGLGAVVVGGFLVSTVFTLVLIPALLGLVFDIQAKWGKIGKSSTVLFILIILFITGCKTNNEYQKPEIATKKNWTLPLGSNIDNSEIKDLQKWWESFNDPLLNELIANSIIENNSVKIAYSRVQEARALRGLLVSKQLPSIEAGGSYQKSKSSENIDYGYNLTKTKAIDIYSVGLDAKWELDLFGFVQKEKKSALALIEANEFELQNILVSLIAEVSGSYAELINLQNNMQINKEKEKLFQDAFQISKARFDAGIENESTLNKWKIGLESCKIQDQNLEEQNLMVIHKIEILLGKQSGELTEKLKFSGKTITLPEKIISVGVPAELLRRRPDILKSEKMLYAETTQVDVEKANLYPRFFFNGYFHLSASDIGKVFTSGSQAYGFGPSVSWNILSRKPVKLKIKAQEEKVNQAIYTFHQSVLVALQEVENGILSFSKEKIRLESYLQNQQSASKNVSIALTQFENGTVNNLLVINAKLELLDQNMAVLYSKNNALKNLIYLYKALGGGWEPPAEANTYVNTATNSENK
jgi:HAE1 family hydrophobic/amphiphilic exporter-1